MKKLLKWLKWIDDNLIKILVVGFIFFSPLVLKLPLKMIGYTYIAIRSEDVYTAIMFIAFFIQVIRKKIQFKKEFLPLFILYWAAVFISTGWGIFIAKNLPYHQLAFLNALRRIEYMGVFFIAMAAVNSKKDFFRYVWLILIGLLIVNIYGVGQKFFGWPAVQTMNPEYAKGYLLFLTPDDRISSTFSGHYDLGAYLVLLMPIVWGFYLARKNMYYIGLFILSVLVLVFTASRISYGAYIMSTFPFLIYFRKPKLIVLALAVTLLFTFTSKTLTSRFQRTFQVKQIYVNQSTGQVVIPQAMTPQELPAGSLYVALKNQNTSAIAVAPQQTELLRERLLEDIHTNERNTGTTMTTTQEQQLVASLSAKLKPINTVVSDISFATRLQVEWPRAIKAFLKNPILGTGPSSITEATDNDYLRAIGEVGALGTILFGAILFAICKMIFEASKKMKDDNRYIYFGFLFGIWGLLINAGYIDVFEASKIAFQFWLMAGIFIGSLLLTKEKSV